MILKVREGVEPFDFNTGPEFLHFDRKGVTVSDMLGQKLLNILPLEQIDGDSVEELVASEELDVPEPIVENPVESPVEVKKTRKTNKK